MSKKIKTTKERGQKRSQGSNDPEDNWCQAGFLLAKQMCIRLNHIDPTDEDPPMPKKNDANKSSNIDNTENILTEKTTTNTNDSNNNNQNNVENNSNDINEGINMNQLTEEMKKTSRK